MQSHSTEQACLHLLNLNESVSLSVVLEYDGSNSTIFDQAVEEDNFYACANFEVSHKSSEQMAFVTLLVKGDTLKIFERRSVALSSEETVTFVQTDKPIYKSGEHVSLDHTSVLPKFEVKVSAPQTITISDDEFQISTCAKYTFGQPVHGKVQVQVCRGFFSSVACEKDKNEICEQFVAQMDFHLC
ncbi:hypothetical protein CapIbe_004515 [Capra ibex]